MEKASELQLGLVTVVGPRGCDIPKCQIKKLDDGLWIATEPIVHDNTAFLVLYIVCTDVGKETDDLGPGPEEINRWKHLFFANLVSNIFIVCVTESPNDGQGMDVNTANFLAVLFGDDKGEGWKNFLNGGIKVTQILHPEKRHDDLMAQIGRSYKNLLQVFPAPSFHCFLEPMVTTPSVYDLPGGFDCNHVVKQTIIGSCQKTDLDLPRFKSINLYLSFLRQSWELTNAVVFNYTIGEFSLDPNLKITLKNPEIDQPVLFNICLAYKALIKPKLDVETKLELETKLNIACEAAEKVRCFFPKSEIFQPIVQEFERLLEKSKENIRIHSNLEVEITTLYEKLLISLQII